MSADEFIFNGIDGSTGDYLLPPLTADQVVDLARDTTPDDERFEELWERNQQLRRGKTRAPVEGVEPNDLAQAGWGVIFHEEADPAIRDALGDLLKLRQKQVGALYREYCGPKGYRTGRSKEQFLQSQGVPTTGPINPKNIPYYLLIVGSPEEIPFSFQYELDVQYAVGRIHFESAEDYENYARSVVAVETGALSLPKRAVLWGPRNQNDPATELSADHLLPPLADFIESDQSDWQVERLVAEQGHKADLLQVLGEESPPAFLFTASHGNSLPLDDPGQPDYQGALITQDWPGRVEPKVKVDPEKHCFSGDDVATGVRQAGMIVFHFACYGAGTPKENSFHQIAVNKPKLNERLYRSSKPFVARLPKRLLAGGALAAVGHVDIAWPESFYVWRKKKRQTEVFESSLKRLLEGSRIGWALDYFNLRHAEISVQIATILDEHRRGKDYDRNHLAQTWLANNDARNYILIGDPAVRLAVARDHAGETDPMKAFTAQDEGFSSEGLIRRIERIEEELKGLRAALTAKKSRER
jgi:hypothetical protein